jgi:hypothetical protein
MKNSHRTAKTFSQLKIKINYCDEKSHSHCSIEAHHFSRLQLNYSQSHDTVRDMLTYYPCRMNKVPAYERNQERKNMFLFQLIDSFVSHLTINQFHHPLNQFQMKIIQQKKNQLKISHSNNHYLSFVIVTDRCGASEWI